MGKRINPVSTSDSEKGKKRLDFLKEFFRQSQMTLEEAAKYVDLGKMTLYNWFRSDDTTLSLAKQVIAGRNCVLEISMSPSGKELDKAVVMRPEEMTIQGRKVVMKNLAFLSIALRECSLCKKEVANILNITESAVHRWFQRDDITFGRLYEICEKCGFDIYISITPEKNMDCSVKGKPKSVTDIRLIENGWSIRSCKEEEL